MRDSSLFELYSPFWYTVDLNLDMVLLIYMCTYL